MLRIDLAWFNTAFGLFPKMPPRNQATTRNLSGHKTRSVFERYSIVSDGDLKDAAKKLGILRQNDTGKRGFTRRST